MKTNENKELCTESLLQLPSCKQNLKPPLFTIKMVTLIIVKYMLLTHVQITDVKALLFREVVEQRAEVGVGKAQRVTTQLQDLLSCRVAQRIPCTSKPLTLPYF